jgi:hypothetical protein
MKTKFVNSVASNKSLSSLNVNDVDVLINDFSSSALQLSSLDLPFQPTPTSQDPSKIDQSFSKEILEENDFSEARIVQAFDTLLESNPSWLEENGFGGAQAQVISASLIFSSFEFSNPGKAKGFDYWYENIFSLPDNTAEIESTQFYTSGYISLTQYEIFITITDAEGNIAGSTHIINNMDATGSTYSSTIHYDANWNITESPYSDSPGFSRSVESLTITKANADGSIAGFTQITNIVDTGAKNYSSYTNHYDANWNITESAYSDSYGNISLTQYETITKTDVDGNIAGYIYVINNTDGSGNSSRLSHYYDANWNIIETSYSDSNGFKSHEEYQIITDANGNISGYIYITNSSDDTSGYYSSSKIQYDANWNIIESTYSALNKELNEIPLINIYCYFNENNSQWNDYQWSLSNTGFFEYQEQRPEDPLYPETLDLVNTEIIGTNHYIIEMNEF